MNRACCRDNVVGGTLLFSGSLGTESQSSPLVLRRTRGGEMRSSVELSNDSKSEVVSFVFPWFGSGACGGACGGLSSMSKSLLSVALMVVNLDSAFTCPDSSLRMASCCWVEKLEFMIEMS